MIIFLEGVPGSGKTSIGQRLAREIKNCVFIPEVVDESFRPFPNELFHTKPQSFFNMSEVRKIQIALGNPSIKYIIDRSYVSALCHEFTLAINSRKPHSLSDTSSYFQSQLKKLSQPTHFIYLITDADKSLGRKNLSPEDIWGSRKGVEIAQAFYALFFLQRNNVITIDTNVKTVDEVYEECKNAVLSIEK